MPLFDTSRKVQVFGSSLAMTIPSLFVKVCEIEKGTELDVIYGLDGVLVVSSLKDPDAIRDSLLLIIDELEEVISENMVERGRRGNARWRRREIEERAR